MVEEAEAAVVEEHQQVGPAWEAEEEVVVGEEGLLLQSRPLVSRHLRK